MLGGSSKGLRLHEDSRAVGPFLHTPWGLADGLSRCEGGLPTRRRMIEQFEAPLWMPKERKDTQ